MVLANPIWLLSLLLLPLPWILFRRKGYIGFPGLKIQKEARGSRILTVMPTLLLSLGFIALAIALARPQDREVVGTESFRSRDIIISLDKSGSMESPFGPTPPSVIGETDLDKDFPGKPPEIFVKAQPNPYSSVGAPGQRRIDHAISAVLDFVRYRHKADTGDRIGIFTFDDDQYWSWPLTHDLKMIFRKVHFADEGIGGGTNFGRVDPGPMDAAIEHFLEMGKSNTRVFIMVTDGEDEIPRRTFNRMADLAKDNGVRLYVIGVGESISRGYDVDILKLAEASGGMSFRVDKPGDLQKSFAAIDEMERSVITVEVNERREELYHWFAIPALILLLFGTLLRAIVVNR